MDANLTKILTEMSPTTLLFFIVCPGVFLGSVVLFLTYKLVNKFGMKFVEAHDRLAKSMESLNSGIIRLIESQTNGFDDIRRKLDLMDKNCQAKLSETCVKITGPRTGDSVAQFYRLPR